MSRPIGARNAAVIAGAVALSAGFSVFIWIAIAMERVRVVQGTCATYQSLETALNRPDALAQLPPGARDIRYYIRPHNGFFEFTFPCDEAEFIAWAERLGWAHDEIRSNHFGGYFLLQGTAGDDALTVHFDKGYYLRSTRPDGTECRLIAFDEINRRVYFQVWLPLPATIKNEPVPSLVYLRDLTTGAAGI